MDELLRAAARRPEPAASAEYAALVLRAAERDQAAAPAAGRGSPPATRA